MRPWLERGKNFEFYETLLAELRLEDFGNDFTKTLKKYFSRQKTR